MWLRRSLKIAMNDAEDLLILCANLARRKDRRFALEMGVGHLLGVPIQFLEAVDGSEIAEARIAKFPKGTTPANFAVRLTKRIALRMFLKSGKRHLLYLEDDVAFREEFEETLRDAMELEVDLFFLGGNQIEDPIPRGRWYECRYLFANHAVLFSREGARKVLAMLGEWQFPQSDVEIAENIRSGRLRAFCQPEWVAFQRRTRSDNCGHPGDVDLGDGASPLMEGDDLAVLDAALNEAKVVLEYGSGFSTVHLGNRLKDWGRLVSVEHDRRWFDQVTTLLREQNLKNVTLLLREPKTGPPHSDFQRFSERNLREYIEAPQKYLKEGDVDLVFVDGRQRINCALAAARLMKPGGYLMIHDFWPTLRYRARLPELLEQYDYLLESPSRERDQGLAVFRKR